MVDIGNPLLPSALARSGIFLLPPIYPRERFFSLMVQLFQMAFLNKAVGHLIGALYPIRQSGGILSTLANVATWTIMVVGFSAFLFSLFALFVFFLGAISAAPPAHSWGYATFEKFNARNRERVRFLFRD